MDSLPARRPIRFERFTSVEEARVRLLVYVSWLKGPVELGIGFATFDLIDLAVNPLHAIFWF